MEGRRAIAILSHVFENRDTKRTLKVARFDDPPIRPGVLKVSMPKKEEAKTKHIEVKS